MNYAEGQAARTVAGSPLANTDERAIARALTELASAQGDLETAARALAGRISPLIPGGSPFERPEKEAGGTTSAPVPLRSRICEEINTRTWGLQFITARINEMVKGVEI